MFGIKQTDSMSCTWIIFNTNRTKPLCNEKNTGRYGYSYKQRNKSDTDNKQIVAKWIQTAIIHMWITLTWQTSKKFFMRLSDNKHRFIPPTPWRCGLTRAMASSFLRFLDHTQRRITVGRTPLGEWSSRRRDLYLTTHNTHNRQTSMPLVGFKPTISAGERPQTYALDRAATGTGNKHRLWRIYIK